MSSLALLLLQVVVTVALAPALAVIAQTISARSYARLGVNITSAYTALLAELRLKERGSWVQKSAPNLALGVALLVASAVPTVMSATPIGAYGDVLALGGVAAALGLLALAAESSRITIEKCCYAVGFGCIVLFAGVALLVLGEAGGLENVVRVAAPHSAWLVLPAIVYFVAASEFLRPFAGLPAGARAAIDLARATFAATLFMFAGRLLLNAPLAVAPSDGGEAALAALTALGFAVLGAALAGFLNSAFAKLRIDAHQDRVIVGLVLGTLAIIGALVAIVV